MTAPRTGASDDRVTIHVSPRASKNVIAGLRNGAWLVRVTAPPVDDAANDAVIDLLARALRVPKRAVRIVGGATSRRKTVGVDGLDAPEIARRLSAILA
jgi:uncharacterized protein (TIGR00251 family)